MVGSCQAVYFLSTVFSRSLAPAGCYFYLVYIYLPGISLCGPDSTFLSIRQFFPKVIHRQYILVFIALSSFPHRLMENPSTKLSNFPIV